MMKRKYKLVRLILVLCLVSLFMTVSTHATDIVKERKIPIYFNGKESTGISGLLVDSTTYVPFRAFCERFGDGNILWEGKTNTASYISEDLKISVHTEKQLVEANGRFIYSERPILNINSRIYLPIRLIAKVFGLDVEWRNNYTVNLTYGDSFLSADEFYDEEDLYWLSRIISAESRGEPLYGKIAVGNVVLNRVNSKSFASTIKDVVFEKGQFTPVINGTLYDEPTSESLIAAKICLEGYSISDEILFFCNPVISTNSWVHNNRELLFIIENHCFYA